MRTHIFYLRRNTKTYDAFIKMLVAESIELMITENIAGEHDVKNNEMASIQIKIESDACLINLIHSKLWEHI